MTDFEAKHPVLTGILFGVVVYVLAVLWLGCA